jgi:hypothetical protein
MDRLSRLSKSSKKGASRRSKSQTPKPATGSKKSARSLKSGKSSGKYSKLRKDEDEIEMVNLNDLHYGNADISKIGAASELRPHEIYENTQYIPNSELRLLDIPLNSSLAFQKLLFYHGTYAIIYVFMMLLGQINRLYTLEKNAEAYIYCADFVLWIPVEYFRLRFGYRGNINETFPELIAF